MSWLGLGLGIDQPSEGGISAFAVKSSGGTSFSTTRIVLSSTGTAYTVPGAVLSSGGTPYNVI